MKVKDEEVTFEVYKAMDSPPNVQSCTQRDDLDKNQAMTKTRIAKSLTIAKPSKPPCDEFKAINPHSKVQS